MTIRQKLDMILENKVVQKLKLKKLTLKVQFWYFLTNYDSLQDCFKTIPFEHVDSWAKMLHFKTHYL